jgi:AAA domain
MGNGLKIEFTPAVRRKTRARIALCGPSGSGKTYTALGFAHVFAPGSIAVIDTEKESADGYEGLNGWKWASFKPATYEPEILIEALAAAAAAGIECVVIDSLSHFWMGAGGVLEQVDNSARRSGSNNSWGGWKEVRPVERRMIDAMVGYPGHLIVTMRTKTEWVVQDNAKGKKEPKKIGTKPEQRDGIEYEFSVVADMDVDNVLTVTKTRVPPLKRAVITEPGPEVAQTILDWLSEGGEALPDLNAFRDRAIEPYATREELLALLAEIQGRHLGTAAVMDDTGEMVALAELIIRKGRALDAGSGPAASGPPAADEDDEAKWVNEFMERLTDSDTPIALKQRRAEVTQAVTGRVIGPDTVNDLAAAIEKRKGSVAA